MKTSSRLLSELSAAHTLPPLTTRWACSELSFRVLLFGPHPFSDSEGTRLAATTPKVHKKQRLMAAHLHEHQKRKLNVTVGGKSDEAKTLPTNSWAPLGFFQLPSHQMQAALAEPRQLETEASHSPFPYSDTQTQL